MTHTDAQRLSFGSVAELYEAARPSYPEAAVDEVIAHSALRPGDRVVEVGAGTGKLTALLVDRGLRVLAIEPSAEMAAVLRTRDLARVEIAEVDFEQWSPNAVVPALVSGAAWHWTAAETRYSLAAQALAHGGTLAALWTFPEWERCALRDELREAYRAAAPQLAPDFPMHPSSVPARLAGDWETEIASAAQFADPVVTAHPWTLQYRAAEYAQLLCTHQDHILLTDEERERLLAAIVAVIEAKGGTLRLPVATRVCLARRI